MTDTPERGTGMATCAEDGCDKTAVDGDMYCVDDLEPEFRRDELLRKIGARVVERVDEEGFHTDRGRSDECVACGYIREDGHADDCSIVKVIQDE